MKKIFLLSMLITSASVSAGERLTGDELKSLHYDKTIAGVHFKSGARKSYYGADGAVQSQADDGTKRSGKWRVPGS